MKQITRIKKKQINQRRPVRIQDFHQNVIAFAKEKGSDFTQVIVTITKNSSGFTQRFKCYFHSGGAFWEGNTPDEAIKKMKEHYKGPSTPVVINDITVDDLPF